MLNVLVETKNEYTTHLSNILTPLIFEGLQSVYKQSLEVAKNNDVLKIFQSFLKAIPKWNQVMIDTETNRIINSSHSYGWLNDLIKATLKSNLIVLMYNPTCKTQSKIEPALYQNIKTTDFIHRVYIECARELWNNPYLLYHNYAPIEIKRNQRDCMNIIKECIKESLRKLLPVKHILQIYLGEEIEIDNNDDQFEKAITDVEERNLTKIIKKDLEDDIGEQFKNNLESVSLSNQSEPKVEATLTPGDKQDVIVKSNSEEKTIGSRILNIINDNSESSSDFVSMLSDKKSKPSPLIDSTTSKSAGTSDSNSLSNLKNSIKKYEETLKPTNPRTIESFDDKIKKVLRKDLATDSDLETSLNYSQEDNDNKYQEIFSNSVLPSNKGKNETKSLKEKNKFFNNYLQF